MDGAKYSTVLLQKTSKIPSIMYLKPKLLFVKSPVDRGFQLFKFKLWDQIKQDPDLWKSL